MTHEFEEICGADGTVHILQHPQRKPQALLIWDKFKTAWENSALAVFPDRAVLVQPSLERLHFRRTWITRFLNGRLYRRTASNRKRRARFNRSK